MLQLALDTATPHATVALCDGERVLASGGREVTTHSEGLLPLIDQVLTRAGKVPADLAAVVCGRGPGSFTGLRIGMATAKGICLASGAPLICVSSLAALALAADDLGESAGRPLVAALLDARRKEVYCGLFRGGVRRGEETVCPPGALGPALLAALDAEGADPAGPAAGLLLVGDGALTYQELLLEQLGPRASMAPGAEIHQVHARWLARRALPRLAAGDVDDLERAVPLYIRASDARLPRIPQRGPAS